MDRHREQTAKQTSGPAGHAVDARVLDDLQRKQELLSAACRCLEDHESYLYFDHLAGLARLAPEAKAHLLELLAVSGQYDAQELAAMRRLIVEDGAIAFKELVDLVREIRVQREIEAMS